MDSVYASYSLFQALESRIGTYIQAWKGFFKYKGVKNKKLRTPERRPTGGSPAEQPIGLFEQFLNRKGVVKMC